MGLFHFHKWEAFNWWVVDNERKQGRFLAGVFRHCTKCDKWQEGWASYGKGWWEDCDRPWVKLERIN